MPWHDMTWCILDYKDSYSKIVGVVWNKIQTIYFQTTCKHFFPLSNLHTFDEKVKYMVFLNDFLIFKGVIRERNLRKKFPMNVCPKRNFWDAGA